MTQSEILKTIESLAKDQGFYSSLYFHLKTEEGKEFLEYLERKGFKDSIDLIMYLEG